MNKNFLIAVFLLFVHFVSGQTDSLAITSQIDTTLKQQLFDQNAINSVDTIGVDSLNIRSGVVIDTIAEEQDTIIGFFNIFKGKPGKAALYSLIVPGGGQVYNRKWVKAPIIIALDAAAFGTAIFWTREYNTFDAEYRLYVNGEPNIYEGINQAALIRQRNRLRKLRDYWWFGAGVFHLVTVVEAFVDRHLLEFDMNEDLTLEVIGIKDPYSVTLASLNYTF